MAAAAVAAPVVGRIGAAGAALAIGQVAAAARSAPAGPGARRRRLLDRHLPGRSSSSASGIGLSNVAAQVAAFVGVEDEVAGVAGGMVETAREVGGALGTAIVASVAIARADDVLAASVAPSRACRWR